MSQQADNARVQNHDRPLALGMSGFEKLVGTPGHRLRHFIRLPLEKVFPSAGHSQRLINLYVSAVGSSHTHQPELRLGVEYLCPCAVCGKDVLVVQGLTIAAQSGRDKGIRAYLTFSRANQREFLLKRMVTERIVDLGTELCL
jgi:hypothetical protein